MKTDSMSNSTITIDRIRIYTDYDVQDARDLASLIVDPDGDGIKSHWQGLSEAFLCGAILHIAYTLKIQHKRNASLNDLYRMVAALESAPSEYEKMTMLEKIRDYPHKDGKSCSAVEITIQGILDRTRRERDSVLEITRSYLREYRKK